MENRKFEKLDVEASLLGFGCMRFPLNQDGHIEEKEAEKMIDLAIESGVTYIDTAYPYHDGDSEPFVGRVLKNILVKVLNLQQNYQSGILIVNKKQWKYLIHN